MPNQPPRPPPDAEAAFELAGHFLGSRPRSAWEVRQRLARAGASRTVSDATLARLTRLGLVDDAAFAAWWIEQRDRHAPRGRAALESELRAKRVDPAVIGAAVSATADPDLGRAEGEEDRALAALDRHLRGRPLPDDPRARQRLGMFLVRRGFTPEMARHALRRHDAED